MSCAIYKDVTLAANGGILRVGHQTLSRAPSAACYRLIPRTPTGPPHPQNPHHFVKRNRPVLNPTPQYTATPQQIRIHRHPHARFHPSKSLSAHPHLPTILQKSSTPIWNPSGNLSCTVPSPTPSPRYLLPVNDEDTIRVKPLSINQYSGSTKHTIITSNTATPFIATGHTTTGHTATCHSATRLGTPPILPPRQRTSPRHAG